MLDFWFPGALQPGKPHGRPRQRRNGSGDHWNWRTETACPCPGTCHAVTVPPTDPERPPVWVTVFTCICAGSGLTLKAEMLGDPEAFTLALLMASVTIGAVAWRVWGNSAQLPTERPDSMRRQTGDA